VDFLLLCRFCCFKGEVFLDGRVSQANTDANRCFLRSYGKFPAEKSELPTSKRWPWVQSTLRAWSVAGGRKVEGRGCAITQKVTHQLPTAAAWVRAQVRPCGICGGQSGSGACFPRGLRFPLPIPILPTAPHSWFIIQCWYSRPVSGRRTKWTHFIPRQVTKKKRMWRASVWHRETRLFG
jgi:hypothetical protein